MPVENEIIEGRRQVRICGPLSIWEAATAWNTLYPLLRAPGQLDIDLTAVAGCDGAGIQIVCQIQKELAKRPEDIRISGISDSLREAMRLAGLDADGFPGGGGEV